jgi:hypothetical protein
MVDNASTGDLAAQMVEFRPAAVLRGICLAFGLLSGLAAGGLIVSALMHGEWRRIAPALVVAVPCLLAVIVLRRRIILTKDGLRSVALLHDFSVPWGSVKRLDRTRTSFLVATDLGLISAGLIAAEDRERLLRLILEKARLSASSEPLRFGLIARYVPRRQDLRLAEFTPHNRRNK